MYEAEAKGPKFYLRLADAKAESETRAAAEAPQSDIEVQARGT